MVTSDELLIILLQDAIIALGGCDRLLLLLFTHHKQNFTEFHSPNVYSDTHVIESETDHLLLPQCLVC